MIRRNITEKVLAALSDTPVVLINGSRQTGKSTLARQLVEEGHAVRYLTFDDSTVLAAAEADPDGFVRSLEERVVIDEVQRVPALFRAIKAEVDKDRRPGRFLLTGSADVLLLPEISESVVGRMEVLTLWPFSQGEVEGRLEQFVDTIFAEEIPSKIAPSDSSEDLLSLRQRVVRGGYPEVVARKQPERRRAWFNAYVTTILQRDVRDLANIEGLTQMPRLLALLAGRSMSLLNYSEVSRSSGLPQSTLKRYMTLLEATFLVQLLPAWHANLGKRLVKSPKVYLSDTGLASHLTGVPAAEGGVDLTPFGGPLENFVAMELRKQITWSERQPDLYHYREHAGREVDILLEDASGRLVGIEVKAGGSVSGSDFSGLRNLRQSRPELFSRGIVLYSGSDVVRFADDLHAVPIPALWRW